MIIDDDITPLGSAARNVATSLQNTQLAPVWVSLVLMGIDFVFVGLVTWFVQFSVAIQAFNGVVATLFSGIAAGVFVGLLLVLNAYTARSFANLGPSVVRAIIVFVPFALFGFGHFTQALNF